MKKLSHRPDVKNSESLGLVLQSLIASFERSDYQHILDKYGVDEFGPNTWYPTKLILDIFLHMQEDVNGTQNLVSIGIRVADVLDVRNKFGSLEAVLEYLPKMEHELHRQNPGSWEVNYADTNCIELFDRTIWPHDLEYGVLYGFARAFSDVKHYHVERVRVEIDDKTGDEVGVYHITWN